MSAFPLTNGRCRLNLPSRIIETAFVTKELIIEAAKGIKDFDKYPVTAQISLLYQQIEAARKHKIPLSMICSALNEAGSKVSLRYLRQALSVVKSRQSSAPSVAVIHSPGPDRKANATADLKPTLQPNTNSKEARELKAEQYVSGGQTNPLLKRQREDKRSED